MKLEKHGLFATMNSMEEAMQYVDMVIQGLPKEERIYALTAAYVLYNSTVEHFNNLEEIQHKGE